MAVTKECPWACCRDKAPMNRQMNMKAGKQNLKKTNICTYLAYFTFKKMPSTCLQHLPYRHSSIYDVIVGTHKATTKSDNSVIPGYLKYVVLKGKKIG